PLVRFRRGPKTLARPRAESRSDLFALSAPQLQRPIRNTKAARSPLQTAVFDSGRIVNGDLLGGAADFLEPGAENDRALDGLLESGIQPDRLVRLAGWTLLGWDVADRDGSVLCAPVHQPGYDLLQLAHVPGIFSSQKILAYRRIKTRRLAVRMG